MSPTSREREYAKRRYEKWQTKQVERYQRRRQRRRVALLAAAAVAVIALVVYGGILAFRGGDDATTTAGATPTAGNNPCPTPNLPAPQSKTWSKAPAASLAEGKTWTWTLETTCGPILVELDGAKAPQAVASTIFLSQQGFYGSTPCHRLTTSGIYVLQCGDPTGQGTGGPGYSYGPVENAPKNGVYPAGTVAMARQGGNGNSMGSQFFLVYKDSPIPADAAGGYTVIGRITGGLGTLEKVAAGGAGGVGGDGAPVRAVSIVSAAVKSS